MEILAIVVLVVALLMILSDRSSRRAAPKRREQPKMGSSKPDWFGGIDPIRTSDLSGIGIGNPPNLCPRCGRPLMPFRVAPMRPAFIEMPLFIGDTTRGAEYCPKCGDPLWKTCRDCDGNREIKVSLEPGEERFCKGCGYEWRQDKVISCPTCRSKGRIATGHDVAHCRGS